MAGNLYNTMYNPDVLSCLANLSSDEVFTPPEVANTMLDMLPQELFSDPTVTFLDIVFQFVPLQDFTKLWTDEELYKKYDLTEAEIEFIDSMIKPMDEIQI